MSAFNFKNIIVKGDPLVKEARAGGAITPGHLLAPLSATGTVVVHPNDSQDASPRFALEYSEIGDNIDEAYASGDQVKYAMFRPGDEVFALVAAGSAAITAGNALVSDGDGTLKKYTAQTVDPTATADETVYSNIIVAYALESVDNSGGASATRILVEVA